MPNINDPNDPNASTLTPGSDAGSMSTGAPGATSRGQQGARIEGTPEETPGPGPRIMSASTLEGDNVMNREGEKLGTIEEIMLDVSSGRVAYAVLAAGATSSSPFRGKRSRWTPTMSASFSISTSSAWKTRRGSIRITGRQWPIGAGPAN